MFLKLAKWPWKKSNLQNANIVSQHQFVEGFVNNCRFNLDRDSAGRVGIGTRNYGNSETKFPFVRKLKWLN